MTCVLKVCSITENADGVILTPCCIPTLCNCRCIAFRLTDCVCVTGVASVQVFLNMNVGGTITPIPVYDSCGNPLNSTDLKKCKVYRGKCGTVQDNHIVIHSVS